jgi:hypothetical protein
MQPRFPSSTLRPNSSTPPILNKPLSALLSLVLFSLCTLFVRSALTLGGTGSISDQKKYEIYVNEGSENSLLTELNEAQEEEQSEEGIEDANEKAVMHEDPSEFDAVPSTPLLNPIETNKIISLRNPTGKQQQQSSEFTAQSDLISTDKKTSLAHDADTNDAKPLIFSSGIHLVTTFFRGKYSSDRLAELLTSLKLNLANPLVSYVHVLWQDVSPESFAQELAPYTHKLILSRVVSQPTYEQFFDYVNHHLKRGTIAIIANGDVYFDDSLKCLKPVDQDSPKFAWRPGMGKRPIFGLTRRHAPQCGEKPDYKDIYDLCDHYIGSHDVFVFAPPVSHDISSMLNHTQNWGLGAENIVIWEFNHSGEWRAFNPCDMVRANHLHCTGERAWSRLDEKNKLVFVSGKKYHNNVRKHGWIKPWYWRKTINCPHEMF